MGKFKELLTFYTYLYIFREPLYLIKKLLKVPQHGE